MKKKSIVLVATALMLMASLIVGGTLAYFTDTDANENVFTMGDVDIVLDEAPVERNGDKWIADDTADRVKENAYEDIFPGAVLPKDPTVHNEGSYGAFVRVKVTVVNGMTMLPMYAEDDTLTDDLYNNCFLEMVGALGEGWSITDGIDAAEAMEKVMNGDTDATFVITYANELAAKTKTTPVFEAITIPGDWTQDDMRLVSIQSTGFEVNVFAEAIQADGFDNVTAAFNAFDGVEEEPAA